MMGFILLNAIGIGGVLVLGRWLMPDNFMMWFASAGNGMAVWRMLILVGLLMLALIRPYYDNRSVRVVWAVASALLLWGGYIYFMDNAAYVFDALYMMIAGVAFGIAALQTTEEPQPVLKPAVHILRQQAARAGHRVTVAAKAAYAQARLVNQNSTLHVSNWQNIQNNDHRVILQRTVHV